MRRRGFDFINVDGQNKYLSDPRALGAGDDVKVIDQVQRGVVQGGSDTYIERLVTVIDERCYLNPNDDFKELDDAVCSSVADVPLLPSPAVSALYASSTRSQRLSRSIT